MLVHRHPISEYSKEELDNFQNKMFLTIEAKSWFILRRHLASTKALPRRCKKFPIVGLQGYSAREPAA